MSGENDGREVRVVAGSTALANGLDEAQRAAVEAAARVQHNEAELHVASSAMSAYSPSFSICGARPPPPLPQDAVTFCHSLPQLGRRVRDCDVAEQSEVR
jgi:hypothetical protein